MPGSQQPISRGHNHGVEFAAAAPPYVHVGVRAGFIAHVVAVWGQTAGVDYRRNLPTFVERRSKFPRAKTDHISELKNVSGRPHSFDRDAASYNFRSRYDLPFLD